MQLSRINPLNSSHAQLCHLVVHIRTHPHTHRSDFVDLTNQQIDQIDRLNCPHHHHHHVHTGGSMASTMIVVPSFNELTMQIVFWSSAPPMYTYDHTHT